LLIVGIFVFFKGKLPQTHPVNRLSPKGIFTKTQTKEKSTELTISSDLTFDKIASQIGLKKGKNFTIDDWKGSWIKDASISEGFVEGYEIWYGGLYVLKNGREIADPHMALLTLYILKYRTPEFAQKAYHKLGVEWNYEEINVKGIKLKSKYELPEIPAFGGAPVQNYLLQSGVFLISISGDERATLDVLKRIIEQYGN